MPETPPLTTTDLSVAEIRRDVQGLTRDIQALTKNVDTVLKIIRDGNGQKPLLIRVELLEGQLVALNATMAEVRKALESREIEDTKGRWQIVSVFVSGMIALISAAVSALILFKKP